MSNNQKSQVSESLLALREQLAGKYMTFKLADEKYGLEILKVREIIGLMDITRVPKSPPFIKGVINLRGKVIPVLDLRLKFEMEEVEPTDQTVIIVVQIDNGENESTMGIIVDEVLEVLNIEPDDIEPPPVLSSENENSDFIMGIGKSENKVIFLLNISNILS